MKDELIGKINETITDLINTYTSVAKEHVNLVPFDSSWTPGQLIQHVILSISGFEKLISGPEAEADRPFDAGVANIKTMLESSGKMSSPKEIEPRMKEYDQTRQLNKLRELNLAVSSAITNANLDSLATAFEFPNGHLTKYEAGYFVVYHTQRHTQQLENIARHLSGSFFIGTA